MKTGVLLAAVLVVGCGRTEAPGSSDGAEVAYVCPTPDQLKGSAPITIAADPRNDVLGEQLSGRVVRCDDLLGFSAADSFTLPLMVSPQPVTASSVTGPTAGACSYSWTIAWTENLAGAAGGTCRWTIGVSATAPATAAP